MEITSRNPCKPVKKPIHIAKEIEPFTRKERKLIFKEAENNFFEPLFKTMLSTGIRSSEAFGLHWNDIDYKRKIISIRKQYIKGELRPLKTKYSARTVDLTPGICEMLDVQKKQLKDRKLQKNKQVFCASKGGYIDVNTFGTRYWVSLLKRANVRVRGLHHLRHTFASELLADGADLLVVSKLLGHSSPMVTLEYYGHVMPPKRSQAAGKIQKLFG